MARRPTEYSASYFNEEKLHERFDLQYDDADDYFMNHLKPRYDRSYKLYTAYNGDRAKEIKSWQSNIFIPYILSTIETLMPRILDARPDFSVQGRNENDQEKASKIQQVNDFTWEIAGMDDKSEDYVRASLIYGISFLETMWKKDERKLKFFTGDDITKVGDKKSYKEETKVMYDAPYAETRDVYELRYDWRNSTHATKQFFFKRLILNGSTIKRWFPDADEYRLELAFRSYSKDLDDHATIRYETKPNHDGAVKGRDYQADYFASSTNRYDGIMDDDMMFHEVKIRHMPFEDTITVMVNGVPIYENPERPIPYRHKEVPYIPLPFLKLPFEYEGLGLPILLENPQLMLNLIKNQRLDNTTLGIHKMWVINPLANIKKEQLVPRPFGIVWSQDPNGVKPIEFSDIKSSAYQEEQLLKGDMQYASGVDDFSRGISGDAGSATEVRHLRESTLERVRLFINHLGSAYSKMMRHWISMYGQFMTEEMTIRITDADGQTIFPIVEPDDLRGEFDFKATVIPSIAGKSDIDKKQNMDLFQLLISLPFVDPKKLTAMVLHSWNRSINSIVKDGEEMYREEEMMMQEGMEGIPPQMQGMGTPNLDELMSGGQMPGGSVPPEVMQQVMTNVMSKGAAGPSQFREAAAPIDITRQPMQTPPTANANPRGLNRGGKVNTNVRQTERGTADPEAALIQRSQNIQR